MMEIWLKMKEPLDRYEISNAGRIRKMINMAHPERAMKFSYPKPFVSKGTLRVALNGGQKVTVSRMVFETFNNDLQDGLVVAHMNGNFTDNRPENLVQVSQMENIHHKKLHGTWQAGPKHPTANPKHSYAVADAVRNALRVAARTENRKLARGERKRIAAENNVCVGFIDTVARGGWHDQTNWN